MQRSLIPVLSRVRQDRDLDDTTVADDDVSMTLSIDELRWLHANETMFDSPTEGPSDSSFIEASTDTGFMTKTPVMYHNATSAASSSVPPSSYKAKLGLSTMHTYPRVRTYPSSSLPRGGRTWERHRHYHLVDDTTLTISTSNSSTNSTSSTSSLSTATPTPRKLSSSLIPAPIAISHSQLTPTKTTSSPIMQLPQASPSQRSVVNPSPGAWIHRHPKPRAPRVRTPSISTIASGPSSSSRSSPSRVTPSSSLSSRPRTRSTASRAAQSRSQTHHHHALSHANSSSPSKRPIHSSMAPRGKVSAKDKETEKERSIWNMLKNPIGVTTKEEEEDVEGSSPESRILDIVNAAERGDEEKEKAVMRSKKGKGLALVIGRGRPPPSTSAFSHSSHNRSGSLSSTISSRRTSPTSSTISISLPKPAPFFRPRPPTPPTSCSSNTPHVHTPLPRTRASSASSNSTSNSLVSAQTISTPATSPSPSVPASPKPPTSLTSTPNPSSSMPVPTKSILSRSASTSSRIQPVPPRSLAALFTRGVSGSSSVSGSVKSVTFVEEPTVHYPVDYGVSSGPDDDTELQDTDDDPFFVDARDDEEEEVRRPRTSQFGTLELELDEDDLASGLSKGALAWEMGLDTDTMDLDLSLELDVSPTVNLDAALELDIGQSYVAPKRENISGIIEEDEEELVEHDAPLVREKDPKGEGKTGLKRFLSLSKPLGSPSKVAEIKSKRRSLPARPAISGPFSLGSLPPSTPPSSSLPSTRSTSPATTKSTQSVRSGSATPVAVPRARSNSNAMRHTFPAHQSRTRSPYYPISTSVPTTPTHIKSHSHSSTPATYTGSTRTTNGNISPASTTSSVGFNSQTSTTTRSGCNPYTSTLRGAPSLESFRSAAGRSVRSFGSTASARSAFRAFLGKVGLVSAECKVDE
ncbi:hypothetical protein H0H93_001800 [Arthromyces matolae]|nr:hypothetical protein H0H93_001800 [Arthromyces matolae]